MCQTKKHKHENTVDTVDPIVTLQTTIHDLPYDTKLNVTQRLDRKSMFNLSEVG